MPKQCPVCCIDSDLVFTTKDWNRKASAQEFEYQKCPRCGLIFLADLPQDLDHYYGESYYSAPKPERLKKVAEAESYQLAMVRQFVKTGRLLEVGPGFGVFAYQAKKAGFDVTVIEKEKKCCRFLADHLGVKAIESAAPHTVLESGQGYDVIALWHVIEHLTFPWEFLKIASKRLSSNGILLVATPNPAAFQFKLQGAQWPHVDAPRHLWLIPLERLVSYLKPLGLEPVMISFNDKGARSWDRFGWQRYLMNHFSNKWPQYIGFILGYCVAKMMGFFDHRNNNGSAYTVIFQKLAA